MKNFFFLALLGLGGAVQAQGIGKGKFMISGAIGYRSQSQDITNTSSNPYSSSSSTQTSTISQFNLDFMGGVFLTDNLALGLAVNNIAQGSSSSSTSATPLTASSWKVGPYVQQYKMLTDQFGFTGTLGAGYEVEQDRSSSRGPSSTYKGIYASLKPGIIFLPIPKFGLTASMGELGYTRLKLDNDNPSGSSSYEEVISLFSAGFGISQLQIGATYFPGR